MRDGLTTDSNDPDLGRGSGGEGQNKKYLVLSDEERRKKYVRPLRTAYKHSTCGSVTTMGLELSETYAVNPHFYGATFCVACNTHFPVAEFTWTRDNEIVGS